MPKRMKMTVAYDKQVAAWTLKGAGEDGEPYDTKREAVKRGVHVGRENGNAQLIIKGGDDKIREERTYGHDPRRSKG